MGQHARTLWSRRWNSTTSILTIPANKATELTSQTIMAGIVPIGAGGGGTNAYIFSNCAAGVTDGIRFNLTHNSGAPLLSFGADSSGTAFAPSRTASNVAENQMAYGSYYDVAATWDGGLDNTGIQFFMSKLGGTMTLLTGSGTNGTTAIKGPAGQPIVIGNSPAVTRAFNGDIFYVVRWNRVLTSRDIQMVQQQGPLRIKEGLVMCWARDRDWGPTGLNPSAVTALSMGASSAFVPRLYVGRRRDFVFMPAASTFQPAWARNANTVLSTGARTPV